MQIELDQLKKIFESAFSEPVDITLNTTKDEVEQWDSMNHLNLIVELEDQLKVRFSKEEIETLYSVQQLINILKSK